jgi:hypothetical protein
MLPAACDIVNIIHSSIKQATLMRRPAVLILPLWLEFPGLSIGSR